MVLYIPKYFSAKILANENIDIQILVDGVDANTGTTIVGFAQAVTQQYNQKLNLKTLSKFGKDLVIPINYESRIWYNPELKSEKFLVSGIIGFIIAMTCVISTALSIVKEKESNTIEQIDVSPIKSTELIIGKLIPYAIIGIIATVIVLFLHIQRLVLKSKEVTLYFLSQLFYLLLHVWVLDCLFLQFQIHNNQHFNSPHLWQHYQLLFYQVLCFQLKACHFGCN